jgi:hypothetical protein
MEQVNISSVEKALKKIDNLTEEALDKLIETYTLQQQPLVDYILQAGAEYQNEDLNVFSIYYFAIVSEAFFQEGIEVASISEEMIDEFHEPFILALDAIYQDEDYEPMQDLIQQHHLQQFMVDEIESPDSDGVVLEEEVQTQLFIVTTSMIGIMNSAIKVSP